MKPYKNRVILKVDVVQEKQPDGTKLDKPSQEATVVVSNTPDLKRGAKVMFNYYGAISIDSKKTKKNLTLVVDECDIYAVL